MRLETLKGLFLYYLCLLFLYRVSGVGAVSGDPFRAIPVTKIDQDTPWKGEGKRYSGIRVLKLGKSLNSKTRRQVDFPSQRLQSIFQAM